MLLSIDAMLAAVIEKEYGVGVLWVFGPEFDEFLGHCIFFLHERQELFQRLPARQPS
jgi:hypothetical protein